jgi:rod shape-determining protein MreC
MSDSRDDFIIALRYALLKKGAKQKFSLFFLILFSILIITLDKLSVPPVNYVRSVLNDLVYRFSVVTSSTEKILIYLSSASKNHFTVYSENKNLREEIELLKKNNYDSSYLLTENENLKLSLGLENIKLQEEEIVTNAKVMVDQNSPYLKSLSINKGTKSGIIKGMTVFSKNYFIGTVIEANYYSARVLLINDLNSKIPTVIQDSNVNTILAGSGDYKDFRLEYLPDDFKLEPNKIIYTSGRAGFLISGLPVAITFLNKKNEVKIKALTDPRQASIVQVAKGQVRN